MSCQGPPEESPGGALLFATAAIGGAIFLAILIFSFTFAFTHHDWRSADQCDPSDQIPFTGSVALSWEESPGAHGYQVLAGYYHSDGIPGPMHPIDEFRCGDLKCPGVLKPWPALRYVTLQPGTWVSICVKSWADIEADGETRRVYSEGCSDAVDVCWPEFMWCDSGECVEVWRASVRP